MAWARQIRSAEALDLALGWGAAARVTGTCRGPVAADEASGTPASPVGATRHPERRCRGTVSVTGQADAEYWLVIAGPLVRACRFEMGDVRVPAGPDEVYC